MPSRLPRSAWSSAAKHTDENTTGWTITITSWGLRDENNTENRGGSTATTSWVLPGHHGANAQQHIDENNTENVSVSTATTSWVVQASEHTADAGRHPLAPLLDVVRDTPVAESTLHQPPRAPLALGVVPVCQRHAHRALGARRSLVLHRQALQTACWNSCIMDRLQ